MTGDFHLIQSSHALCRSEARGGRHPTARYKDRLPFAICYQAPASGALEPWPFRVQHHLREHLNPPISVLTGGSLPIILDSVSIRTSAPLGSPSAHLSLLASGKYRLCSALCEGHKQERWAGLASVNPIQSGERDRDLAARGCGLFSVESGGSWWKVG